ncbi:MAG: metal-dependent phosphohydrolase [Deltaproteobacteria bacterium]|nr:MAG: metal-dependent phosphohydrolase [Deltaproteobacteria bacterium]RLC14546.1 MAG: metal-dependent phosphohydrolase [Deltaproteobacteria bacterium]
MNTFSNFEPPGTRSKGLSPYSYVQSKDKSLENHLAIHLKEITRIGAALSVEKNIHKLLEMIVDEAKSLTNADAGTLYILDKEQKALQFQILQNDSMKIRLGGTSGTETNLPSVPLFDSQGNPNHANVSSYAALTGEVINIPDVYDAEGFDFSGPRNYDKSTGYRSKSMLVLAMRNHENETIGVLQLLNAQDLETGDIVSFSPDYIDLVVSLASQGAVALTNTQLIQNLTDLFYAFIKSIATAMDEKSPYTGGHITRVVDLTMMIAKEINDTGQAPFQNTCFSDDEMEELRLAAWMHDVGKITTPEVIVDKATKLQSFFDRIEFIETRFDLIATAIENDFLKHKLELSAEGKLDPEMISRLDQDMSEQITTVTKDFAFLRDINQAVEFMDDDKLKQLQNIAKKTYHLNDRQRPYLTEDEILNLSIRKGNLTEEERGIIENHVEVTFKMLNELPFPKKHAMVPEYAAGHHEKLDGSGYPRHLSKDSLPLQSRIMAVADIFEALTAKDRPYKKPMKLSQALNILSFLKKDGHIDPDIHDLVISSNLFLEYAKAFMNPDQIDDE